MAEKGKHIVQWATFLGRNGWDAPHDVPDDMGTDALNWDLYDSAGLGSKRRGTTSVYDPSAAIVAVFGGYVPAQNDGARELWIVIKEPTVEIRRMAGSDTFSAALTLPSTINTALELVSFAILNGKLYLAYDDAANRVKVFDPGYSTTAIRYAGLADAPFPSVADTGSGTYAATQRYYKQCYTEQRASVTVRRGELSSSVSFTPSGSGTHARITKSAAISEGETHWEIYGSVDNVNFYGPIFTTAVGTTTVDDNSTPSTWADTYDAAPVIGENFPMPSVKFLYSNGSRVFGFGVYETSAGDSHTPQAGTVYLTPALDSSSIHDDERVRNTATQGVGRVVLGRNAGGEDVGLNGLGNVTYAFQSRGIYGLIPTESPTTPYRRVQISTTHGACSHYSIVPAHDEMGREALYFLDPQLGPCRVNADGTIEWVGKDVKDLWDQAPGLLNARRFTHGIYYQAKHQIWWWIVTSNNLNLLPNTVIVLDVTLMRRDASGDLRGGWVRYTGDLAKAYCSTMMSTTLGVTMSRDLSPYVGQAGYGGESEADLLVKADVSGATTDATESGTQAFQAHIDSKAFVVPPLFHNKRLTRAYLLGEAGSATIQQSLIRNYGDETSRTDTRTLVASGSETRVLKQMEATSLNDAFVFQVRLGDASATASAFTLDRWVGAVEVEDVPR